MKPNFFRNKLSKDEHLEILYKRINDYVNENGFNKTLRDFNISKNALIKIRKNNFVKMEILLDIYEKISGQYYIVD